MKKISGFTIQELIMVVVLVGILFAVSAPLMFEIAKSWQLAQNRNELCESSKIAMDRMIREIRLIKDKKSVLTANNAIFKFTDVNSNDITFYLSGNVLMRSVAGIANKLADKVSSLTFNYYDANEAPITAVQVNPSSTNIARIVINLSFLSGTALSFESGVSPRRLQ